MTDNSELTQVRFDKLCEVFPHMAEKARPVGSGAFGIVVEGKIPAEVPLVTKIFFNFRGKQHTDMLKAYGTETKVMHFLDGMSFDGVPLPSLVGPAHKLYDPDYYAYYTMTKLPGVARSWRYNTPDSELPQNPKAHFHAVGRLIASFQSTATQLLAGQPGIMNVGGHGRVEEIRELGVETNRKLREAGRYLQAHKRGSIIHGDFYGSNLLVQGEKLSGLLDLSHVGLSENFAADFVNIPRGGIVPALEGFEEASGGHFEPEMVTITRIAGHTNYLNAHWLDGQREPVVEALERELAALEGPSRG